MKMVWAEPQPMLAILSEARAWTAVGVWPFSRSPVPRVPYLLSPHVNARPLTGSDHPSPAREVVVGERKTLPL
jgi:hypothetical protein